MNRELPKWRHALFLVPLCLYVFTAARAPGWLDATLIAYNVGQLRLSSWVNSHNLFIVIGHALTNLFRFADPHYVLVLTCSFFGALTVYLIFLVGLEIGRKSSAILGAAALMLSHSLWWHSTMVEVYSLNSAIIAGILLVLFRYRRTCRIEYLYVAFFLWGLGCSNHVLMGLFLPAFAVLAVMLGFQHRVDGWRPYLWMTLSFLVGISLLLLLFVRDTVGAYRALSGVATDGVRPLWEALKSSIDRATGGHFKEYMFVDEISQSQKRFWRFNYPFLLFANYPSVALPLGFFGMWVMWKSDGWKSISIFFILALAAQVIWSANYYIWDMYAFALPAYVLFSAPIIYGFDWVFSRTRVSRIALTCLIPTLLLPLFLYPSAERWYDNDRFITRYFNSYEMLSWTAPSWKPVAYIANPNKRNYNLAEQVAEEVFRIVPPGSTILASESRLDYPLRLYYQKTLGMRQDIRYLPYFGMFLTEARSHGLAASLDRSLNRSTPTYICSVGPPDRQILNSLWLRHDPDADPLVVENMPVQRFLEEFPGVVFHRVELVPDEGVCMYRIEKSAVATVLPAPGGAE